MAKLFQVLRRSEPDIVRLNLAQYEQLLMQSQYGLSGPYVGTAYQDREQVENSFKGYVYGAFKADGIVFACMLTRLLAFSEARFQWQRITNGRSSTLPRALFRP